jgi:hypothetical protein
MLLTQQCSRTFAKTQQACVGLWLLCSVVCSVQFSNSLLPCILLLVTVVTKQLFLGLLSNVAEFLLAAAASTTAMPFWTSATVAFILEKQHAIVSPLLTVSHTRHCLQECHLPATPKLLQQVFNIQVKP